MVVFRLPADSTWQCLDEAKLTFLVFDKEVIGGDDFVGQVQVTGAMLREKMNAEQILKVELKLAPEFKTENNQACMLSFRVYDDVMGMAITALDTYKEAKVALAGELSVISELQILWENFFSNLFPYEGDRPVFTSPSYGLRLRMVLVDTCDFPL
jgi:hypothetical protein